MRLHVSKLHFLVQCKMVFTTMWQPLTSLQQVNWGGVRKTAFEKYANRRMSHFAPGGWGSPPDPLERRAKRDLERPEKSPGRTIVSWLYRYHAGVTSNKLKMHKTRRDIMESQTRKLTLFQKCLAAALMSQNW